MKPQPRPSANDLVQQRLEGDVAELKREIAELKRALWLYVGKSRALTMTALVEVAEVRHHLGMEPPKRKAPVDGRLPIKMAAFDLSLSESGLRKMALRDPTIGEKIGGRWFIDPSKVTPKH